MISGPWGHDREWERSVVERIRRDGVGPEIMSFYEPTPNWDLVGVNAGGWEHAERHAKDAIRAGAVYLNDEAIAKRVAQRKLWREGVREAMAEGAAKRAKEAADRKAREAAIAAEHRAWDKQQEERARRAREQQAEWDSAPSLNEQLRIMGSRWICTVCNGKSRIERDGAGYRITCFDCGKSAWGSHASLWKVLSQ